MRYGLSERALKKITRVFKNNSNIDEAIIFGSRAMGNYREGSDIDLTLKGKVTFDDLLRLESELENEMLPYKFDLSLFKSIDNQDLIEHINNVGKTLYKKEN